MVIFCLQLENKTLETLNLGCNSFGSEGLAILKDSLARNRSLLRLGLQATKLNCQGRFAVLVRSFDAENSKYSLLKGLSGAFGQ